MVIGVLLCEGESIHGCSEDIVRKYGKVAKVILG